MKYVIATAMLLALSTAYADGKRSPKKMTDAQLDQVVAGAVIPTFGIDTARAAGGQTANAAPGLATAASAGRP
jgi:NAD/NADP transhydrogenase alpha subunit